MHALTALAATGEPAPIAEVLGYVALSLALAVCTFGSLLIQRANRNRLARRARRIGGAR